MKNLKIGDKTKDGLIVLKESAPKGEFIKAFTPGMNKPGLVHKSQIGFKIPKRDK